MSGLNAVRKMLMGVWRGHAGQEADKAAEIFAANQRQLAEYYAARRAAQTGGTPQVEMIMVDPFAGDQYRLHPPGAKSMSGVRKLKPQEVKSVAPMGAVQSTDPFWYNPERQKLVRFPESGMHNKSIMDPTYAERLGVPPLTPGGDTSAIDAALMGRTDRKDPNKLFLMQTSNPDEAALNNLKALINRGDLPHSILDYSAGERLYEGVPVDDLLKAISIDDLDTWKKFARGGLAQYKECTCQK